MKSSIITNYTDVTFLATIQSNLRSCSSFCFSVSFIKKAGLDLLKNDIAAAIDRGVKGKLITSTYQNFTDVGTGQLKNPRKGVTTNGSILYDIHMDQEIPDYLMEDFKWIA